VGGGGGLEVSVCVLCWRGVLVWRERAKGGLHMPVTKVLTIALLLLLV
jgi:hypothetical protein